MRGAAGHLRGDRAAGAGGLVREARAGLRRAGRRDGEGPAGHGGACGLFRKRECPGRSRLAEASGSIFILYK